MYKFCTLFLALFVSGCASYSGNKHMNQVKIRSLEADAQNAFTAPATQDIPVQQYLEERSGYIIYGDNMDTEKLASLLSTSEALHNEGKPLVHPDYSKNLLRADALTAISDDGYFITTTGNINHSKHFFIYRSSEEAYTFVSSEDFRIVFRDNIFGDIAIVKVDMKTPRYLKIRETPLAKGETLFGGNALIHHSAAGQYLKEDRKGDEEKVLGSNPHITDGKTIITTIPVTFGDTGSPIVDTNGELCGIQNGINFRSIYRYDLGKKSFASSLENNRIMDIIARDRKENLIPPLANLN